MVIDRLNDRRRSGVGSEWGICEALNRSRGVIMVDIKYIDPARGEEC